MCMRMSVCVCVYVCDNDDDLLWELLKNMNL